MSKLYFMNNGYFDRRAMMTMGVNVKESENSIGIFGTGFKYAVAIILRHSGKISISTKTEDGSIELTVFEKVAETIRGKEFQIVKMNGADAGFTTHYGIGWAPWQAYRELYSNCIDEKGVISDSEEDIGNFDTVVTVDCQEIYDAWYNADLYFIKGDPDYVDTVNGVEIYREQRQFFYYRGIAVATMQEEGLFSYNITDHITLTEDRTAKYMHEITSPIEMCYQKMDDRELLAPALGSKECFEANLSFSDWMEPSKEFVEVAEQLKRTGRGVNDSVRKVLIKQQKRKGDYLGRPLSPTDQKMLEKAMQFLRDINITIDDFEILTVQGMGDGVCGRALNMKIYISELPFQMGTKQVASTLIEEWVHLKLSCDDFSRDMQNWLFDKILSIGEQVNGEPL